MRKLKKREFPSGFSIGLFLVVFTLSAYFMGGLQWNAIWRFHRIGSAVPVKIRYAFSWPVEEPAGKIVFAELNRFSARTGIEIIPEIVSWDELRTKIKVDAAVNDLPDIFNCFGGDASLLYLVNKGYLLEIDEYQKLSKSFRDRDYERDAFDYFKVGGKRYGIPIMNIRTFWACNRKLFEKYQLQYPKTFEELIQVAKIFREHDIVPLAVGSRGGSPASFLFSEFYSQFPGGIAEINSLPSSYQVNTGNMRKACGIIQVMRKNRVFPDDTFASGDWSPSLSLYNQGKAAMVFSCNYFYSRIPAAMIKNTDLIPVPKIRGGGLNIQNAAISAPGFGFVINKKSFENPQKARALVQLADLLCDDGMGKALAKVGILPVKNTLKSQDFHLTPFLKRLSNQKIQKIPAHVFHYPDPDSLAVFLNSLDKFWAGAIDAKQFIFKTQQSLNESKIRR
jgi:raffinose/stachyose/melibiose transport system substrate-binding protein